VEDAGTGPKLDCCPASCLDYSACHATPIRGAKRLKEMCTAGDSLPLSRTTRLGSTFCAGSKVLIISPLYFWNLDSSFAYSSIMDGQCHQQKNSRFYAKHEEFAVHHFINRCPCVSTSLYPQLYLILGPRYFVEPYLPRSSSIVRHILSQSVDNFSAF
jgi:hypothetical protein